jgi:Domain of unknown function (DUF4153)
MKMTDRAKAAVEILTGALILGLLGDALMRATPWGLNVLVWTLAALIVICALIRHRLEAMRAVAWFALPAVAFSAAFVWRDSPALALLNLMALGVTGSLALWRAQGGGVLAAGLAEYALAAVVTGLNTAFGGFALALKDLPWKEVFAQRWLARAAAIGCGVALAIPPLLVFGALFASADAVFAHLLKDALHFNFLTLASHVFLFGFFAWTSAGWLRGALLGKRPAFGAGRRVPFFSLGIAEIGAALGLIDLLFLIFAVIQVRYLFGGAGHVQATTGLTYAEYARRGFFELVAVAALALPLLLAAHWLLRKEDPSYERWFRMLAAALVLLLFVIMASAVERMRLYQREYGLTELRVYTTAFMAWLAVVLVWFGVTVLRSRRRRFAAGALVAGYALIVALEILNPDAFITRTNAARALEGRTFDAAYAASLSGDAVPELVGMLPRLQAKDRCVIASRLLEWQTKVQPADWRTWNHSRAAAGKAIQQNRTALQAMSCAKNKQP